MFRLGSEVWTGIKGIALCGSCMCRVQQNNECAGCRNEGCEDKEQCKNLQCCKAKNLNGCWNTAISLHRQRTGQFMDQSFCTVCREYGEEILLDLLEKKGKDDIAYHYRGQLNGDYDIPETEEGILICS